MNDQYWRDDDGNVICCPECGSDDVEKEIHETKLCMVHYWICMECCNIWVAD